MSVTRVTKTLAPEPAELARQAALVHPDFGEQHMTITYGDTVRLTLGRSIVIGTVAFVGRSDLLVVQPEGMNTDATANTFDLRYWKAEVLGSAVAA